MNRWDLRRWIALQSFNAIRWLRVDQSECVHCENWHTHITYATTKTLTLTRHGVGGGKTTSISYSSIGLVLRMVVDSKRVVWMSMLNIVDLSTYFMYWFAYTKWHQNSNTLWWANTNHTYKHTHRYEWTRKHNAPCHMQVLTSSYATLSIIW